MFSAPYFSHNFFRTVNRTVYRTEKDFAILYVMARRKVGKESIRKIQQSSGSYYIRIPIQLIRLFGWRERQKVVVKKYGKGFLIKDWVNKKPRARLRSQAKKKK